MTYNKIFARSFSKNEQKRLGYGALGSLIMAMGIWVLFKHYLFQFSSSIMQTSVDAGLEMLMIKKDTAISRHLEGEKGELRSMCDVFESRSEFCELRGDIRVHGKSSAISVGSLQSGIQVGNYSWNTRPYTRKGTAAAMNLVKNWSVNYVTGDNQMPHCAINYSVPAILFSVGGFSGNHFHDFSDLVIPLYMTSQEFNGEVQFLVTDYRPWWIHKFQRILEKLSRYEIIDIDSQDNVHCYSSLIISLKCHKELGIDRSKSPSGVSMKDFRQFLRSAYSLKRTEAIKLRDGPEDRRPRLMIISRRNSRAFMNVGRIVKETRNSGFEVVVAEANLSTDLSAFAQIVNSCDVLMGVHGAGLTNMVFLPDNAILIQIVPFGDIDGLARDDFEKPLNEMNIRYLKYKIGVKESSLIKQYPFDDEVIRGPLSLHKHGWNAVNAIYLEQQDVKLDMDRFKPTLSKALELLHDQ